MILISKKTTCLSLRNVFLAPLLRNESGAALVMALIVMVLILTLVPVAMQLTSAEFDRSQNFKESREAFFIAEAGLEHAKALTEASSLRTVLAGPDDLVSAKSSVAADDNDNGTFGIGTQVTRPDGNLYEEMALNGNTYYIRAYDNDDGNANFDIDNIIILNSVGIVDGITTTVEAEVYNPPGIPVSAVTTNGYLAVPGNPTVSGTCGSVHSNDDLTLSGSPNIAQDATATGTYVPGGSVGGTGAGGQNEIPIPLLVPTDFERYADYTLASDGNVYDAGETFVSSSPWNGWTYLGPIWKKAGPIAVDASLYIEGDAVLAGNAGSPGTPWNITIVATGYIKVSGALTIANKKNPADPVDIQNIFFVAGTDVQYTGNATQTIDGIIYATDQLKLAGNPTINGAALAYDASSVESLVPSNTVTGSVVLNYGCGLTMPSGSVDIKVISWNEL